MTGPRLAALVLVATLVAALASAAPEEPAPGGARLLPGRLVGGPSILADGSVLAPCEDQTLWVLGPEAEVLDSWSAPARFALPVAVGRRAANEPIAVALVTGAVYLLVWDSLTRSLGVEARFDLGAPATALAWSEANTLLVAAEDGAVEAWAGGRQRLWRTQITPPARRLISLGAQGARALAEDRLVVLDQEGRPGSVEAFPGPLVDALETPGGLLYVWTPQEVWRRSASSSGFRRFLSDEAVLGVVIDRLGRLVVTSPTRVRRWNAEGQRLDEVALARPALGPACLDDRGRYLVPTATGLEAWAYDGRWLGTYGTAGATSAVLGPGGTAAWGRSDWWVEVWQGFRPPPYAWAQPGGGPGRSYRGTQPLAGAPRARSWAEDPNYGFFAQLVASGREEAQDQVLDLFEDEAARGTLLDRWPFANLILVQLGRSGTVDLILHQLQLKNNWPGHRARAYRLLAQTAGPDDREDLIALLGQEFDPTAAALAARSLGQVGWDGDGRLTRLLADLVARFPRDAGVADACIDAARRLWDFNGRSADPALVPLVTAVYQGPYPRAIKAKAQDFFQALVEAP